MMMFISSPESKRFSSGVWETWTVKHVLIIINSLGCALFNFTLNIPNWCEVKRSQLDILIAFNCWFRNSLFFFEPLEETRELNCSTLIINALDVSSCSRNIQSCRKVDHKCWKRVQRKNFFWVQLNFDTKIWNFSMNQVAHMKFPLSTCLRRHGSDHRQATWQSDSVNRTLHKTFLPTED